MELKDVMDEIESIIQGLEFGSYGLDFFIHEGLISKIEVRKSVQRKIVDQKNSKLRCALLHA